MRPVKSMPDWLKHLSITEIKTAIAEISAMMKEPMSDLERAVLYADRVDLRAALALAEAAVIKEGRP